MAARWLVAILLAALFSADAALADGWSRSGGPAYIDEGFRPTCRPGPRRRYQIGRRCVWPRRASVAYVTGGAPTRMRLFRRIRRPVLSGHAAYTPQVPGSLRRSAGPLRFDRVSDDPFVDALIESPSARTVPTLDAYGIPAIEGVPPIVIINPKPPFGIRPSSPFLDDPLR